MPATQAQLDEIYAITDDYDNTIFAFSPINAKLVYAYTGPILKFGNKRVPVARFNRDQVVGPFGEDIWFVPGATNHVATPLIDLINNYIAWGPFDGVDLNADVD